MEAALAAAKKALEGDNSDEIKRTQEALMQAMQSVAEELYAKPEEGAAAGAEATAANAESEPQGSQEQGDVIDADFTMDDDQK